MRLQRVGESRESYLIAARQYARRKFSELRESPEYRYCHCSFVADEALRLTENRFVVDLGTFGVEGFTFQDSFTAGLSYLNTGDSYELSLCFRSDLERFFIACVGDFVERHPKLCGS